MTIDDVRRKSLRGIKDVSAYTANYDFSDCVYDAIQEMQTNSLCSRVEIRKRIGINGELSQVNVIDGGSGYTYPPTVTITDNLFLDCLSFDSALSEHGTATQFSCAKTHTIEFWMDQATPASTEYVCYGSTGGTSSISFDGTNIYYLAGGYQAVVAHGGMSSGTKTHWLIRRVGTSVDFFKNKIQLSTTRTLGGDSDFYIYSFGAFNAASNFLSAKIAKFRVYSSALSDAQNERQYNSGYGNSPLDTAAYVIWEMDGTGGTGTTETDQSGNGKTLTLVNSPIRMSWSSGEPNSTSKAVAEAIIENGSVTSVVLTSPGIGYFSQPTITFTGGNGTVALAVAPISGTTFQKTITAKYSSSTSSEIPIECLYVDAMFKVGTDGTKTPIKLKDRYTVSAEKDTGVSSTSSEDLSGAVLWDRNNIQIFTPWDMTDCTLEMWIRFQIPYVQDANIGTNANSYIDTIPVQFQNRLISGVKYHIYEAMEELSGFSGKYQPMMKVFGEQWFRRDLPYVKQEVNGTKAAETVHYVKPATVAGLE